MNKKIKYTAAALLVIAILPLPIGYFTFLRICVSIASIMSILQYRKENNQNLVICFGLILILFNPIIPIHFYSKGAWILPDLITAGIFAYWGYRDSLDDEEWTMCSVEGCSNRIKINESTIYCSIHIEEYSK